MKKLVENKSSDQVFQRKNTSAHASQLLIKQKCLAFSVLAVVTRLLSENPLKG